METYREYLVVLERAITESQSLGPVVVVGDFNAHLGKLAGPKGLGDANTQGVMLYDLMCRCDLNAVTQGCAACGEKHTRHRT